LRPPVVPVDVAVPAQPTDVTIRQVEEADLRAVVRIEQASFSQPWPYTAFERFLGATGFLVATHDEEVVGYVVGDVTADDSCAVGHVKDLAVAPDARGQGTGRSLLVRSLFALAVAGAALVRLEVRKSNEPALALYRDVGFETARHVPRYYQDDEDALVMTLDLSAWRTGSEP
jgi:ribosomal-protein-alanine N-acetyltransferase